MTITRSETSSMTTQEDAGFRCQAITLLHSLASHRGGGIARGTSRLVCRVARAHNPAHSSPQASSCAADGC